MTELAQQPAELAWVAVEAVLYAAAVAVGAIAGLGRVDGHGVRRAGVAAGNPAGSDVCRQLARVAAQTSAARRPAPAGSGNAELQDQEA